MNTSNDNKIVIGSEEWCELPQLGVPAIKARVDSGAKTSAIHADKIKTFERDGKQWVSFELHPVQRSSKTTVHCEAEVADTRTIRSSIGASERRYVIKTSVKLQSRSFPIELTLANRDSMGYRMLLGREAMSGRMLVDPEASFLTGEVGADELKEIYKAKTKTSAGLKIGVLASNPDLYSNRRIIEAGEARGHTMEFLNIRHCYMKMDAKTPEVHYRGGKVLNDLDAVIPRIRPSLTYYGCSLTRLFDTIGTYCLNSASAITSSRDKLYSLQLLLEKGVDIPTTGFANSPLDTGDLINMVGGSPLIVKLLEGTQGKGVVLAETKKAAESVIDAFKSLKANIIVQQFVKEAGGKDIRCFVIGGKVVASMQRQAAPGEFRANVHMGGTASLIKVTPEEKRVAIKAAKAMNLDVAGVDIIRSSRGPLLLEVNSSPGLEGIEAATDKDIASLMIDAIEKKLRWNA